MLILQKLFNQEGADFKPVIWHTETITESGPDYLLTIY
jgi:hypothetical protein